MIMTKEKIFIDNYHSWKRWTMRGFLVLVGLALVLLGILVGTGKIG